MTRHTSLIASFFIVAAMPWAAHAAINKCVGADGKVVFSDQACNTGQAATSIQAPTKSVPSSAKALSDSSPPNTDHSRPNVFVYDTLCAEDTRLFDRDAGKLRDEDRRMRRERLDKRCNPQMRLAAAEQDKASLVRECKSRREELQRSKSLPERPPGYASRAPEIAGSEVWLKANCN